MKNKKINRFRFVGHKPAKEIQRQALIFENVENARDITKRKIAEESYNKSRKELADTLEELKAREEEIQQQLEELLIQEESLQESERRFRSLLENIRLIAVVLDREGRVTFCNDYFLEVTDRQEKEVIGQDFFNMFVPLEERHHIRKLLEDAVSQGNILPSGTNFILTKSGERRLVKWYNTIHFDPYGHVAGSASIGEDITERKQVENALRKSEEQYRLIFENSPLGIMHYNENGVIVNCNDKFIDIIGASREAITGFNMLTSLKDRNMKLAVKATMVGRIGHYEGNYLSVTGNKITPMKAVYERVTSPNGDFLGAVGIFEDITERRLAEEALKASENRLSLIFNSVSDLVFLIRVEQDDCFRCLTVNKSYMLHTGLTEEQLIGRRVEEIFSEPFLSEIIAKYKRAIIGGKPIKYEETADTPKGRLVVEIVLTPIFDEQANCTHLLGAARDITERKQAEQKLKYLSLHDALTGLYNRAYFEQELKRLAGERYAPVGIMVCDVDGLKLVNDTLGHGTGDVLLVDAADVIKKSFQTGDMIARIGGDEFVILLPNSRRQAVENAYRRIRSAIAEYNLENPAVPLNISVGFAVSKEKLTDLSDIFKEADNNMYREKLHSRLSSRSALVQTLMKALEARDFITEGHADRMQDLVAAMAGNLGLTESMTADLRIFARFHDIGKVGIPDRILFKPGRLTPEEFTEMQRHCEIGHRIAESAPELVPIANWILKHHEWWNGKGYPLGLKGEEIPLPCRILALADAYDAMTNNRPYKKAISCEAAAVELKRCAGTQFDPEMVVKFMEVLEKWKNL